MNKKLFSWKALAGLALLVAMGMTSCKNTTEVDPNDPYNTQKPTKPSSSLDGDYDWEVTIAKTSDFADQWKSVASKVQKAVAELDQIDIKINCGAYALDGKTLSLPAIWGKNNEGKIVNVVFSGSFKSKTDANGNELALVVNTDDVAGAEVNIYLPTDEFDFDLTAQKVKPTLYGESTVLDMFTAKANETKKNALSVGDGVKVNVITMSGALADTENVVAKLITGDESLVKGEGAKVGNQKVYVKNLVVAADAKVSGAHEAALETVTVAEGTTLTLGNAKSEIESIVGLGTAKKPTKLVMAGDADDFSKIGAISNVIVSGNAFEIDKVTKIPTNIDDLSIFTNVAFNMDVNISEGASETEFDGVVNLSVDDDADITFADVEFGKKAVLNISGAEVVKSKKSVINMLQWVKSSSKYDYVKDADEDNLSAANAKSEGVEIVQDLTNDWDKLIDGKTYNITWDGLIFHHKVIEAAELALNGDDKVDGAKKKYQQKVASDGISKANASQEYNDYEKAWTDLYGALAKDPIHDDKGKEIEANFVAYTDQEIYDLNKKGKYPWEGYYRNYADEYAFVTDANKKIDGADWFTVYYQSTTTSTLEPEDVLITFTDCTVAGKALTVDKLNDLLDDISPRFSSAKEAWFKVVLDGEPLQWKKTSGWDYILQ